MQCRRETEKGPSPYCPIHDIGSERYERYEHSRLATARDGQRVLRRAIPPPVWLNGRLGRNIDEWLEVDLTERQLMTVTGELIRINFDENKLFIRVRVTARQLECSYSPETEVDLLESRRGLIQVTGEFVIDETGHRLRLTAVNRIEPVDLSPLVFAP